MCYCDSKFFYSLTCNIWYLCRRRKFISDSPPLVIESKTYLPLKDTGKALNINVKWNEKLRRVEINRKDNINDIGQKQEVSNKININTASKEELKQIIHIDDDRAEQIVHLRPFKSIEDLTKS